MTHLTRTTRIHAPLARVYDLAHDPRHWSDWYVGFSDEKELPAAPGETAARTVMVGAPFPLTQRVLQDRLSETTAHWRSRTEGTPECVELTSSCRLVMLTGESDWTWAASNGDTEVTVELDLRVPRGFCDRAGLTTLERAEAECLEQSLENLKRYCESASA